MSDVTLRSLILKETASIFENSKEYETFKKMLTAISMSDGINTVETLEGPLYHLSITKKSDLIFRNQSTEILRLNLENLLAKTVLDVKFTPQVKDKFIKFVEIISTKFKIDTVKVIKEINTLFSYESLGRFKSGLILNSDLSRDIGCFEFVMDSYFTVKVCSFYDNNSISIKFELENFTSEIHDKSRYPEYSLTCYHMSGLIESNLKAFINEKNN